MVPDNVSSIHQNRGGREGSPTWLLSSVKEHDGSAAKAARFGAAAVCRISTMPSLFRFLVVVGLICGAAYVTVFALANFVKYKPREIIVTVPQEKFIKPQH
jgi:hypothetical protein